MAKKKTSVLKTLDDQVSTKQVESYRGEISWAEGRPYLVNQPIVLSENPEDALLALTRKVLDLPYHGENPALEGLTIGEATVVSMGTAAADGNERARTEIFDRLLGKPMQNVKSQSVNLSGSLNDFLDSVAEKTKVQSVEVPIEDAELVSNTDVEDL